jgi:hypothetical protein
VSFNVSHNLVETEAAKWSPNSSANKVKGSMIYYPSSMPVRENCETFFFAPATETAMQYIPVARMKAKVC